MAIKTFTNSPYFDDFDSTKNYLRILFRPGRSVQVRELNQLQSSLQDQIDKFGRHIFKDGDRVLDGYTTYDPNIRSVTVDFADSQTDVTDAELKTLIGKEIYKSGVSTLTAKIVGVEDTVSENGGYRLYIKYSGADGSTTEFAFADDLKIGTGEASVTLGDYTYAADATFATFDEVKTGTIAANTYWGGVFQDSGVFFIKGHFVYTDATQAFAAKTSTTTASGSAVFDIADGVDEIVTASDDQSLLDNANGQPNVNAPGADRYVIELTLNFIPTTDNTVAEGQQRIKLLDVVEDTVVIPARSTQYSELGKTLAQRTEEESGSYTIKPFKYDLREYYNDGSGNRGKYLSSELSGGETVEQAQGKYVLSIEPSTAYVQGYRVELENKEDIVGDKGRADTGTKNDYKLSASRGMYIEGSFNDDGGTLDQSDITNFIFAPNKTYTLFQSAAASTTVIGTCRIHSIENTGIQSGGSTKRVYIYDINLADGKVLSDAQILNIDNTDSTDADTDTYIQNTSGFTLNDIEDNQSRMVYPLGGYPVKTVTENDSSYVLLKRFYNENPTLTNDKITIDASSFGTFASSDSDDYVVVQEGTSTDAIYVKAVTLQSAGAEAELTLAHEDGTTPVGSGAGNDITIFAPVEVSADIRTKRLTTGESTTFNGAEFLDPGGVLTLDHIDVNAITSITFNGGSDISSDFTLISGQEDTHYGYSKILYTGNQTYKLDTGTGLEVEYDRWVWQSDGDFFTADSYQVDDGQGGWTTADLEDIPSYEELKLSNCVDFRPGITDSSEGSGVVPNSIITVNFDYYKPRKDIVVLNQLGEIKVITGVAGTSTKYPETPSDSLLLYQIDKPGYVYSLNDINVDKVDNSRYTMRDIGDLDTRIKKLEYYTSLSRLESEAANTQLQDSSGERFKNGIITDSFRGHGVGDTMSSGYKVAIDSDEFSARATYLSDNARWAYVNTGSSSELYEGTDAVAAVDTPPSTWNGVANTATRYSGKRKNAVTLDYIEKLLISQPYASDHISVNPYDVPTWIGTLEISPSSDEWKDVNHVPDIIENAEGNNSALLKEIANNPNILGTEWNEWQTQWVGKTIKTGRWWRRRRRTIQVADTFTETTWEGRRGTRREFERQLRDGIQTSLVENFNREVIDDSLLNVTFIPFIRSRKIYFKAQMLKPNTTFYLYFDDVNITSYATEASFVQFGGNEGSSNASGDVTRYDGQTSISGAGGGITTDAAGEVEGWVVIPNNDSIRFRTGTRQIRLTDSSTNNKALELSSADSTYYAKGLLETRQRTILSTRQLVLERTQVTQARNQLISEKTVWRDPIAQTFMIGNEPAGIFLSSVDLYFQAKDPNLPVEMSIVSVENGIPTQNTVPFSKIVKASGDVNVDENNAQTLTNFKFDTPIYLQPGVEYAIVLVSNSARYRVWHSEVGGTNKVSSGNAEKITKNPYLGVMLKSQNASTWTPDQNKDLKFKLNRADFKSDASQTVYFAGISPERGHVTYINVADGGSGYLGGSPTVTLSGGGATTQGTAKAYVGQGGVVDYIEVETNGVGYTSAPTVTIANPNAINLPTSWVDVAADTFTLPDTMVEIKNGQKFIYNDGGGAALGGLADNGTYYAVAVDPNDTSVEVPFSRVFKMTETAFASWPSGGGLASSGLKNIGASAGTDAQTFTPDSADVATASAVIDTWKATSYLPIIQEMLLPEASATYQFEIGKPSGSVDSYEVIPNEVLYTTTRVTHDANSGWDSDASPEVFQTGADTLKLTSTLSTTNSKISPVIDLDRLSLVTFDNIINSSSSLETARDSGQCAARYITKKVKLSSPADQVNVYLEAMRPDSSTSIEVYAKFRYLNSNESFDALPWERVNVVGNKAIPVSTNFEFSEVKYEGSTTTEFTELAIKVLFKSSGANKLSPEIKNLRVIATV